LCLRDRSRRKTFRPYTPGQAFLLPPSPLDWLPEDHLARFIMDVVKKLEQSLAPDVGAVPWLLLRATSMSGPGQFSRVTYVQRVDTKGGWRPRTVAT
jgi:hypothetical protein